MEEAIRLLRASADQGLPAGQFHLGSLYAGVDGVPQDYEAVLHWYGAAAAQACGLQATG